MNIIDFYLLELKRLHSWMGAAVSDLTSEEWHYLGEGRGNNIAFLVWHCARTQDNILRFILQGRSTIWQEGGWHDRLGLPPRVQGTGMAAEDARKFQIADPQLFMEYTNTVWREFEDHIASIQDGGAALSEKKVTVKPLGDMPAIQVIGQVCISHCFIHYGEIAGILGALGKQGLPI